MKITPAVQSLLGQISVLSQEEKNVLTSLLLQDTSSEKDEEKRIADSRFTAGRCCPHCKGKHVVKNGSSCGRKRYVCRECGRSFSIKTGTVLAGTHKKLTVWDKYVACMMECKTIQQTAKICGICTKTAFVWRHKILYAMDDNIHKGIVLDGVVEADETFVTLSYKGNHKKSQRFSMPRAPHKRGHEVHTSGLNHEKVCISGAVNRNGRSVAAPTNLAKPSSKEIQDWLSKHIKDETVICTDSNRAYKKVVAAKKLTHVVFNAKKHEYSRGQYGIQRIGSYHSRLKKFLVRFNGVSTKHLSNYLVWNNFHNYAKETTGEKLRIFKNLMETGRSFMRWYMISARPCKPVN